MGRSDTLQPVLPAVRGWPLFDAAASRALEQQALAAVAPHALMALAGLAVARVLLATQPGAQRVCAVAGPGNNGGDAIVAATVLHRAGLQARVALLGDPARLPPDAAWALADAVAAGVSVVAGPPDLDDADAAIDGLLGLGATRAPAGALADAVARLNAAGRPVIAVDLPSGLCADRGVTLGGPAVRAAHTVALLTLKPGLFTAAGRDHAGRVWLDTLGVASPVSDMQLSAPPQGALAGAPAPHAAHKGRFGDVAVVGGAPGMAGAARLAARAALAAGAGRVYVALLDPAAGDDAAAPELMQRALAALQDPGWLASRTVVAGCGGGQAIAAALPPLLAHAARLVLDADALNVIAAEPALQAGLRARAARRRSTVLTPHPLEAARLLGTAAADVQADRPAAARQLARQFGAVVLLKGSGTLVATPAGALQFNPTGNALLSAAGTGDVLAGWLGGLWSRTAEAATAEAIAAAAAFRHGLAADRLAAGPQPPPAILAGELIHHLRHAASLP